jgi:hypothetical protein
MFENFLKQPQPQQTPERTAIVYVSMLFNSKCLDNESVVITDDEIQYIYIDYKAVRAKKALSTTFKLPLWLMTNLKEKTIEAVVDDLLEVARRIDE